MLNSPHKIFDVIIIGAGYSGCLVAKYLDAKITALLIDQNNLILKKFLMTGSGYANITNTLPLNDFMENIIDNNKFMYSALTRYNSQHIMQMCDDMKIRYFEKSSHRIHLKDSNEKFKEIMLKDLQAKANLEILLNCKISEMYYANDVFVVTSKNEQTFCAKQVIVATGGMSYSRLTGSDGYGYVLAKQFHHTIKTVFPIGVGIFVNDNALIKLQGSSSDHVTVHVYNSHNKIICCETGEIMVTHFGLGGPVINRVSGYISQQLLTTPSVKLCICFIDKKTILSELKQYRVLKFCFKNFNQKILDYLYIKFNINKLWETSNLTKQQRQLIINSLSTYELLINQTRSLNEAINTGGGISLKELNASTCMSKLQPCLYFIGEVIDVNPRSNGFNLTVCFACARVTADEINRIFYTSDK